MAVLEDCAMDYSIQALVDNELPPEEAHAMMEAIIAQPEAMRRYEALLAQKNLLKKWWQNRLLN